MKNKIIILLFLVIVLFLTFWIRVQDRVQELKDLTDAEDKARLRWLEARKELKIAEEEFEKLKNHNAGTNTILKK